MGMNNKLANFGLVLCIVLIALLATANGLYVGNIRTKLANEEQRVTDAGDGWYQTLGALKLALERIDTLEQELANEELFSEYLRRELAEEQRRIPICQEDVFIQGIGDFVSTPDIPGGAWEAYECGPAMDDFLPSRILD